ncbi:MAG: DEAD/DEAH box helicase family protein [Candidatus Paceibacterota bacterium]
MKKELYPHQKDCVKAIITALKEGRTEYAHCVTGFGKSLVMAELTSIGLKNGKRVLQLVPNHKLCTQNYKQAFDYVDNKHKPLIGICSAQSKTFQINRQAVIATQTSFLSRRATSGRFDLLIVDECDLISPDVGTTYQKIIKSLRRINPNMKITGLTGSPYRANQGTIHDKVKDGNVIFEGQCYESDIPYLIHEGFLSSIEMLNTHYQADLEGVKKIGNDFDANEVGVRFDKIIDNAVEDFKILLDEKNIKTALIFASTIPNGKRIVEKYGNDNECKLAHGDLTQYERDKLIHWLENGTGKRYLVNVGLYTRGFDYQALQALVLLRATLSLRLYIQIMGRVLRSHDEKEVAYVADYGSNVARFGPIDAIVPPKPPRKGDALKKECLAILDGTIEFEGVTYRAGEQCSYMNPIGLKKCRVCQAEFINTDESGLYVMRTKAQALAEKLADNTVTYEVDKVTYVIGPSKDGTDMIKMLFWADDELGTQLLHTQFICLNHTGTAQNIAKSFVLKMFKDPKDFYKLGAVGVNVENMFALLTEHPHYFKTVKTITLEPDGRFKKLKSIGWL